MLTVLIILLLVINLLWLGLLFFALPGNWMIVITTSLFAWWKHEDGIFSIYTLIAIAVLALAGEIIEFFAGMGGAKKAGAGWKAAIGAIFGVIIGAVFGTIIIPVPLLGTLIGGCLGAGILTWFIEMNSGRKMDHSVKAGLGAGIGVFVGTGSKICIGIMIWLIIAFAAFLG